MKIFWFRRDLRLQDNAALFAALQAGETLPIFIFDKDILDDLKDKEDKRVSFIHEQVQWLKEQLEEMSSTLRVFHGRPVDIFELLMEEYEIDGVYAGADYEPYAIKRDEEVAEKLSEQDIKLELVKDHVIFAYDEVINQ